jgi:hypothetical protein
MASLHALAAPMALILPLLGQASALPVIAGTAGAELTASSSLTAEAAPICRKEPGAGGREIAEPVAEIANPLNAIQRSQTVNQVRIERRITIRISPQRPATSNSLFASLPQQSLRTRYEERKMEKCIPVGGIAGVQTGSGSQLLLFLRDRRIVRVNLEKACLARDFYSGFYVEQSKDGKICVDRDKLQSRTGANCEITRMRQLIAVSE